jgi:cytochrome c556
VPFDAAVAKQNAEKLVSDFEKLKDLFPEGSDKGPPETWAKAEIWTDREGFEAARTKALEASKAATGVTEQAQLGDALGAVGDACKGCHEKYRRPKS